MLEPLQERIIRAVANAHPDHGGTLRLHRCATGKILAFGHDRRLAFVRFVPDDAIYCLLATDVNNMPDGVTLRVKEGTECREKLSIHEKVQGSRALKYRMVRLDCRIFKGSLDVFKLEIGIVPEDSLLRNSGSQKIKNVLDAYSHSSNTRAAPTLLGINRDALKVLHRYLPLETGKSIARSV